MANTVVSPAVPSSNGVGAGVSTAALAAEKSIVYGGTLGGVVTVEASLDGGTTYKEVATFTGPGTKRVKVACDYMRCKTAGWTGGDGTVDIGAAPATVTAAPFTVPAGNSASASIDVSAYGEDLTFLVAGIDYGALVVEMSEDDTDWHQAPVPTFTSPGIKTVKLQTSYVRVRRTGYEAAGATVTAFVAGVLATTGTSGLAAGALAATTAGRAIMAAGYVTPVKMDAASYFEIANDFPLAAGGTLPAPLAKDVHNDATGDYLADALGGVYSLATAVTSEAEAAQLTFGNQLVLNPAAGLIFEARVRLNIPGATPSADERWVVGLCSDHTNAEDALDAVTSNVWFRGEGANLNIYCEGDDGTTDTDDNDTGVDYVDNTWMLLKIDFTSLAAIAFSVNGVVVDTVSAPLLSASTKLQPIFCYQRDAGTEINLLEVDWFRAYQTR